MSAKETGGAAVTAWLLGDDTGLSSKSLAREFLGMSHESEGHWSGISWPHDPADIGRCFRLIEKAPEVRVAVTGLAKKNEFWMALSNHWDEIHKMMDEEVGIYWQKSRSAPKTYDFMRGVLDTARTAT